MKHFATIVLLLTAMTATAKGDAEITYAGGGRYTCSGDKYKCAQIDANNRALDEQQRARWQAQDDARRAKERENQQRYDREYQSALGKNL